jgi:hypothetical protein
MSLPDISQLLLAAQKSPQPAAAAKNAVESDKKSGNKIELSADYFRDVVTVENGTVAVSAAETRTHIGALADFFTSATARLKEKYRAAYALTFSPNLLEKGLAALEAGSYGGVLSLLGASSEEMTAVQKEVRVSLIAQNRVALFNNFKTGLMSSIVGA